MQSTRLTLICHARTVAQKLASFPTNESVENSQYTSDTLAMRFASASRLLCGPELRTQQTAGWFGDQPQIDQALRDCDWGRWHGQSIKDLQQTEAGALQAWISDPHAAPHGGESMAQLSERVQAWLLSLQGTPGHVVAITHPFVIRAALMQVVQGTVSNAIDIEPLAAVDLRFNGIWRLRLPGIDVEGAC